MKNNINKKELFKIETINEGRTLSKNEMNEISGGSFCESLFIGCIIKFTCDGLIFEEEKNGTIAILGLCLCNEKL